MREILFKGKRIADGKWVYGDYCHPDALNEDGYEEHIIIERPADGSEYYVIPETVGQFTGLTDRNGNKIFEGDIVQAALDGRYYSVEYITDNEYAFNFVDLEKGYTYSLYDFNDVIVIGNIHDNPELISGDSNAN